MLSRAIVLLGCLFLLDCHSAPPPRTGDTRVPVSRDVWLSAHPEEQDFNMGAASTIKLKVNQELGILDFDVQPLKGKTIVDAWLYVKVADKGRWGLNGGTDLRRLSISTVGKDWVEGKSSDAGIDRDGRGATFREASYGRSDWGWKGANVFEVSLGNSSSLRVEGELEPYQGWHRVHLDPRVIRALVAGASHGLLLLDGSTDYEINCRIFSRESGENAPYLMVQTGPPDTSPPAPVQELRIDPAPNRATRELGAALISLRVPEGAFSYDVQIDGRPVDRWQIPLATSPGATQTFPLLDLPPDSPLRVSVVAVDEAGNRAPAVRADGRASPAIQVPQLPDLEFHPQGGEPPTLEKARIWALPELTNVSPTTARVLYEGEAEEFARRNAVWDGATRTVRLAAARGEIVSFQVALQGQVSNASLKLSDLAGPQTISAKNSRLWRSWYVGEDAAYALPMTGTISCPMADNAIKRQKLQTVTVDYAIPTTAAPGHYTGNLTLRTRNAAVTLKLELHLYHAVIPEEIFFNPELNCYQGPGEAGSARFRKSHVLAHYHRCSINRVPYSQSGQSDQDYLPKTDQAGHVTDWTDFDRRLGGLLDGSWFKDNPRAGVPVATLYLPHFENYPLRFRDHYQPGEHASQPPGDTLRITQHNILARPLPEAMSRQYQDAFVKNVGEFVAHFTQRGWNRTVFQMYLNNKGNYKLSEIFWTLDEPYKATDWDALNFWGGLFKAGVNDPEPYTPAWHQEFFARGGVAAMQRNRPTFLFRGDISRITEQGSISDGKMNMVYGDASLRTLANARERMPALLYTYGSTSSVHSNKWNNTAWCLRTYTRYGDGVLPWQSLGDTWNLLHGDREGDGNALIIDSGKAGFGEAVASLRVHALRRGAQDCELLRLLQLKMGWSREHIAALIEQKVNLGSSSRLDESARAVEFGSLRSSDFVALKEGILRLLEPTSAP